MVDAFGSNRIQVKPPQRGIFPLDHDSECKNFMAVYLKCLNENQSDHVYCRIQAKSYLQCRMEHDLMLKEELSNLGYDENNNNNNLENRVVIKSSESKEAKGFIAGTGVRASNKWKLWGNYSTIPNSTSQSPQSSSVDDVTKNKDSADNNKDNNSKV